MEIQQIHHEPLGHASYLIASEETGEAVVVDPRRDVAPYLDAAASRGYRIAHVADTHQHNDYLSGLRELTERTGAEALGSAYADRLGYTHRPVRDGDRITLGEVTIEVLHTPGHTPEHISFLVHDASHSREEPALLVSGGALLVGDLARPDLLGTPEQTRDSAAAFCTTIQQKILTLPDHVLVYPTHVAGSLCGGSIGSRLVTTVGYERRTNPVLTRVQDADGFVEQCLQLDDLPAVPPYWPRMRGQNAEGVEPVGTVDPPPPMSAEDVADLAVGSDGAGEDAPVVLDIRSPEAFAGGHVPGAINVAFGTSFPTWAGTALPADARTVLVAEDDQDLVEVAWSLLRIGYPVPEGHLRGGMMAWRTSGREVAQLPTVDATTVDPDAFVVLDVRQPDEWTAGHAPEAVHITGAELPRRIEEVPRDGDVLVVCGSGYRSTVAASLLRRHGHDRITNLTGGMAAWRAAGLPTTTDEER